MAADAALDSLSAKDANITTTHTACYRDLDKLNIQQSNDTLHDKGKYMT